jgi:hypothetical protein
MMGDGVSVLTWGAFRLDLREERVFKGGMEVHLRGKTLRFFGILQDTLAVF